MVKTYADFMNEISKEELYRGLLAHGLFPEKLPPIFTSEPFFNYCQGLKQSFTDKAYHYIYHESIRNINVPRPLGIVNPMAYQRLCLCLSEHWNKLQEHFLNKTNGQTHKISRIHLRKRFNKASLFEMNYKNWKTDGSPEPDLLLGKKYLVEADISTCFPSIYTHSLPWALVGKSESKSYIKSPILFNEIDRCCRQMKDGETHGLIIGPHTSNLLSEIILTVIDKKLFDLGWRYIRNIDDYSCYVTTREEGQHFLVDLGDQLRYFDLSLNHKKTSIQELPVVAEDKWVRKINSLSLLLQQHKVVNYKVVRAYLDEATELMRDNQMNSAILNYAIKVLSGQSNQMSNNAKEYSVKIILHLATIYTYLIPLLDTNVFEPFAVGSETVCRFANIIFKEGISCRNYEAISYAIYFSLKYNFKLDDIDADKSTESENCMFMLFTWLYYKKHGINNASFKKKAEELSENDKDFERNWVFVFEVLTQGKLKGEWKPMKKAKVSFIRAPFNEVCP